MNTLLRIFNIIMLITWSISVNASHNWGGLDLCTLYPEKMPPGISASLLPEPQSRGAGLMQSFCAQCHELPGPGRHTAAQWPLVLERMTTLSEVASKFRGLMGKINTINTEEKQILLNYLQRYALKPLVNKPHGAGAAAFANHCSTCHNLPDPAYYKASEWPSIIKRMQRNMQVMNSIPPTPDAIIQIQLYLQQQGATPYSNYDMTSYTTHQSYTIKQDTNGILIRTDSFFALGPFFILVVLGLVRWIRSHQRL